LSQTLASNGRLFSPFLQPQGAVGAFIRRAVEEKPWEEMHFLFTQNTYGLHGFALANVWLNWVTRGMYIGQRRVVLSTQVCLGGISVLHYG
jgi:succinate-acetate transporter protein